MAGALGPNERVDNMDAKASKATGLLVIEESGVTSEGRTSYLL